MSEHRHPRCVVAIARVESALAKVGAERKPPAGYEARVLAAIEYEAQRAAEPDPRDEDDDAHDYEAHAQAEGLEDAVLDRADKGSP